MKQTMPKGRNAGPKVTAPAATRKPAAKNSDQKPTKKKIEVSVEKKTPKSADMVTLTKSEFNAIMETIGKLSMASEKIDSQATENQNSIERNNRINSEERERSFLSHPNENQRQQNLPPDHVTGLPKAHLSLAEKKRLEWQQANDSAATGWHNRDGNQKAMSDPRPVRDQRQTYSNQRMEEQNVNNTPHFLTAAEKKKLQWQKERAELNALDKYDPWGRAGGGAPIKDLLGNVVNDYTKRQEVLSSVNQPWTETVSNFKAIDPTAYPSRYPPLQKAQSHPDRMDAVLNGVPSSQGAMMSSFRSGALAPDGSRGLSEKERQKLEWLEDLEKQREEQRLRKLVEKRERREESPERYYWAEKSGVPNRQDEGRGHPPPTDVQEPPGAMRWVDPSTQGQVDVSPNELYRHSAPPLKGQGVTTAPTQNPNNGEGNNTYMHGQNRFVDPITKGEQEEKRRKYLELQEFNRKEVEKREQQRKEEKERRIREELEDERKFHQTKQAANPTNATTLPKPATIEAAPMNKEELERRRQESLSNALEAARLEAEREKKQRLIEKLKKGNHDVSHLEAKLTSRSGADAANTTRRPQQEPSRQQPNAGVPTYVEPKYVPGLGDVSSVPNSGPNYSESYRNNYKDGPGNSTQTHRGLEQKSSREFGTQTDNREASRESTQVEYHMPEPKSNNNNNTKKVRVVSAPKSDPPKKQRQEGGSRSRASKQNQGQRPMWGYRNTERKKPIKQSERDATHGTQERLQRRINRQNELLDMMARNADLVPDYRAPTLSRARSRSYESGAEEPKASHENNRLGRNASRHNRSRSQSHSPVRRHSRSQSRSPVPARNATNRSSRAPSPPLPSIRRHGDANQEVDKYRDRLSVGGTSQTNFVPFIRSSNVLNPAHAESPLPMSREPTEMQKARRAYQGVLQPAKYGQHMEPYYPAGANGMDPLLNPSLVTEHPTHRQGQILQHLSTLRQALREKQKEMNSISETMPDQYGGRRIVSPVYD